MANIVIRLIKTLAINGLEAFGKYYSSYRGFVVDRDDPENLGRLKVVVPIISQQALNVWAHPKGVYSGDGYGSQCIPNRGDMVWVTFEGGYPEVPLWEHGHRARREIPNGDEYRDKDCFWFVTPKGNRLLLYDTKNFVHIQSVTGNSVRLSEKGISLYTKKGIFLGDMEQAEQQAVLGNKLENLLKDFVQELGAISKIPTPDGPSGAISGSPDWNTFKNRWEARWSEFLSNKVKLD